jgi:hypothetical protein
MSRLRNEDGFTLMEVVTSMTVGLVMLGAILGLLESTVRLNTGVMAKTDAMQRGRLGMDQLTQQLRSQVCLDWDNSAIIQGSDASTVSFYADFSAGGRPPVKRTLRFDTTSRRITSQLFSAPTPTPNPLTPASYPTLPEATNVVLDEISPALNLDTTDPADTVPFLRYFAYEEQADGVLRAEKELTPPLDKAEAARAARVEIAFVSHATGSQDRGKAVVLTDQVMARHSDPNLAVPDPKCV